MGAKETYMLRTVIFGCLTVTLMACATVTPDSAAAKLAAGARAGSVGCVPQLATRIPVKADDCAGFGRSYTRAEISNTGALDTAEALRLLDPALKVRIR
jgi:hypothetical protein